MGSSASRRHRRATAKLAALALGAGTTFGVLGSVETSAVHPAAADTATADTATAGTATARTATGDTAAGHSSPIVGSGPGAAWCPGPGGEDGLDSYKLGHGQECLIRVGDRGAIVHYDHSLTVWNAGHVTCFVAGRNAVEFNEEFTTRGDTDSAKIFKGSLKKDDACEMIIHDNG